MKAFIKGVGHYVPERVVTNSDLEKLMDTSNEWIVIFAQLNIFSPRVENQKKHLKIKFFL
ncbi:hypothetical protein [Ornithobacterium rhinotracheale]|uniref:hypothetical protein n=1 Tax=Ornithobacterium rhinotracheale TaxID=28251 RepID=UPI003FD5C551